MNWKDFLKSTEAIIVFGGLTLTALYGRIFIYITALAYFLINVPNAWNWIKAKTTKAFEDIKDKVEGK